MDKQSPGRPFSATQPFLVDDWHVDPTALRISRDDTTQNIDPQLMAVLCELARHAGSVVERKELQTLVSSGGVVHLDALTSAIIKLRKMLDDTPRDPKFIESVANQGYRLIARVTPSK